MSRAESRRIAAVHRLVAAAVLAAGFPAAAAAQSITTAPVTAVPVASPWLLLALFLTLLLGGAWLLRRRQQLGMAIVSAVLLASGLWMVHAQASLEFTDPAGETVAVPVTQIVSGGDIQGFERPTFTNGTDVSLRIAGIVEPDFDDCYPDGLDEPLPSPDPFTDTACEVDMVLGSGESCTVDVDAMCRARADETDAIIGVSPASVEFVEGMTGSVTVTVDASSPVPGSNIVAAIPGGSDFSVQSTTCGATLAVGASCTITFTNAGEEGPTDISVAGDNTNTVTATLTSASAPTISITNPVQQNRIITVGGGTLSLEITNDAGSAIDATGITVTNKAAAPDVVVDDSDCASVAAGATCTLELSSATPYAPATLTIGGANVSNSPTTLVAFSYLGGLVFEESGGSGKVVIDVAQEFTSAWANGSANIANASSPDDGVANTNAIVADPTCTSDTSNCAAQRCRDIGADWYLPARNELTAIQSALCSNGTVPCNAGGFSSAFYWSSTQIPTTNASMVQFPSGGLFSIGRSASILVRCVRPF